MWKKRKEGDQDAEEGVSKAAVSSARWGLVWPREPLSRDALDKHFRQKWGK